MRKDIIGSQKINIETEIFFLKEDDKIVVYSPLLDLSSYALTYDEAEYSFHEALRIVEDDAQEKFDKGIIP